VTWRRPLKYLLNKINYGCGALSKEKQGVPSNSSGPAGVHDEQGVCMSPPGALSGDSAASAVAPVAGKSLDSAVFLA
jgi:hypothetical protein